MKIMLNEPLLYISALIDRGTLFKFDGRKVLRNEKCLSHITNSPERHWQLNISSIRQYSHKHIYVHAQWWLERRALSVIRKKLFSGFCRFRAWLWPLMPIAHQKSKCGQFGHCTMGYRKAAPNPIQVFHRTNRIELSRVHRTVRVRIAIFTDDRSIRYILLCIKVYERALYECGKIMVDISKYESINHTHIVDGYC